MTCKLGDIYFWYGCYKDKETGTKSRSSWHLAVVDDKYGLDLSSDIACYSDENCHNLGNIYETCWASIIREMAKLCIFECDEEYMADLMEVLIEEMHKISNDKLREFRKINGE